MQINPVKPNSYLILLNPLYCIYRHLKVRHKTRGQCWSNTSFQHDVDGPGFELATDADIFDDTFFCDVWTPQKKENGHSLFKNM